MPSSTLPTILDRRQKHAEQYLARAGVTPSYKMIEGSKVHAVDEITAKQIRRRV
jgi:hypothetical protein